MDKLFSPCHCVEVRKALRKLQESLRRHTAVGLCDDVGSRSAETLSVRCPVCQDTQLYPTEDARRLAEWLVKVGLKPRE